MQIIVSKDGRLVFEAIDGRLNQKDSARTDFLCFASPIIGAAYVNYQDAIRRIEGMGYVTSVITKPTMFKAHADLLKAMFGICEHEFDEFMPLFEDGVVCGETAVCVHCGVTAIAETFMNEE